MYYSVSTPNFNFQDTYSFAQKGYKKILVNDGIITIALFNGTGLGYAQEPVSLVNSRQALMEVVSNVHHPSITFDYEGQQVSYDKTINPDMQYRVLHHSLMNHKGGKMPLYFLRSFEKLASHLANLPFRESLARYSVVNNFVNINLVFDNGIELEVTQIPDVEEMAFSIHHDGATMAMATATGEVLAKKMLNILKESKIVDGVS